MLNKKNTKTIVIPALLGISLIGGGLMMYTNTQTQKDVNISNDADFIEWMKKHDQSYETVQEYEMRRANFRESKQYMQDYAMRYGKNRYAIPGLIYPVGERTGSKTFCDLKKSNSKITGDVTGGLEANAMAHLSHEEYKILLGF